MDHRNGSRGPEIAIEGQKSGRTLLGKETLNRRVSPRFEEDWQVSPQVQRGHHRAMDVGCRVLPVGADRWSDEDDTKRFVVHLKTIRRWEAGEVCAIPLVVLGLARPLRREILRLHSASLFRITPLGNVMGFARTVRHIAGIQGVIAPRLSSRIWTRSST